MRNSALHFQGSQFIGIPLLSIWILSLRETQFLSAGVPPSTYKQYHWLPDLLGQHFKPGIAL